MKRTFTKYPSNYIKSSTLSDGLTRGELVSIMVDKISKDYPDSRSYTTEDMIRYIKSKGINARRGEVEDAFAVAKKWQFGDNKGAQYYG